MSSKQEVRSQEPEACGADLPVCEPASWPAFRHDPGRRGRRPRTRGSALPFALLVLTAASAATTTVFDYIPLSIDGQPAPLAAYRGKVLLIVNVASQSNFTPQYEALESLYEKYKDQGLVVLAFPANDFGQQEPGTNEEIKKTSQDYKVTFPMFAKLAAAGDHVSPLYQFLTDKKANRSTAGPIRWNFTKFLVSREGKPVARFEPDVEPKAPELVNAIEKVLSGKSLEPEKPDPDDNPY